jgi:hypothetical protein
MEYGVIEQGSTVDLAVRRGSCRSGLGQFRGLTEQTLCAERLYLVNELSGRTIEDGACKEEADTAEN